MQQLVVVVVMMLLVEVVGLPARVVPRTRRGSLVHLRLPGMCHSHEQQQVVAEHLVELLMPDPSSSSFYSQLLLQPRHITLLIQARVSIFLWGAWSKDV
jgi:hypothetical protein